MVLVVIMIKQKRKDKIFLRLAGISAIIMTILTIISLFTDIYQQNVLPILILTIAGISIYYGFFILAQKVKVKRLKYLFIILIILEIIGFFLDVFPSKSELTLKVALNSLYYLSIINFVLGISLFSRKLKNEFGSLIRLIAIFYLITSFWIDLMIVGVFLFNQFFYMTLFLFGGVAGIFLYILEAILFFKVSKT